MEPLKVDVAPPSSAAMGWEDWVQTEPAGALPASDHSDAFGHELDFFMPNLASSFSPHGQAEWLSGVDYSGDEYTDQHRLALVNATLAFQATYAASLGYSPPGQMGYPDYTGSQYAWDQANAHQYHKRTARRDVTDDVKEGEVKGRVWFLAQHWNGCRRLQDILASGPEDQKQLICAELHGKVAESIECKHANHVLSKLIVEMKPTESNFVIDEIMQTRGALYTSQHVFGCRIIERLLEHSRQNDLTELIAQLVAHARELCTNQFGNYVMQHLLEHGRKEDKHAIAAMLSEHSDDALFLDYHAGIVVAHALERCSQPDRRALAGRLLGSDALLLSMSKQRQGHHAVCNLLKGGDPERTQAKALLASRLEELRSSRYGRVVEQALVAAFPDEFPGAA